MRSNCLFEAVKAKLKDPKNVEMHVLPKCVNEGKLHFYWVDKKTALMYHYTKNHNNSQSLWFEGKTDWKRNAVLEMMILNHAYDKYHDLKKMLHVAKKHHLHTSEQEVVEMYESLEFEKSITD